MEGQLNKWANFITRWRKKYFVLQSNGILIYFDKKNGHLNHYSNKKKEDPLRIIINSGTKLLHLRASNVAEKIKWLNALRLSQDKFHSSKEMQFEQSRFKEFAKSPAKHVDFYSQENPNKNDLRTTSPKRQSDVIGEKNKVAKLIQNVWTSQAICDEKLNEIVQKIDMNSSIAEYFEKLEKSGSSLLRAVTNCVAVVEEDRKQIKALIHKVWSHLEKYEKEANNKNLSVSLDWKELGKIKLELDGLKIQVEESAILSSKPSKRSNSSIREDENYSKKEPYQKGRNSTQKIKNIIMNRSHSPDSSRRKSKTIKKLSKPIKSFEDEVNNTSFNKHEHRKSTEERDSNQQIDFSTRNEKKNIRNGKYDTMESFNSSGNQDDKFCFKRKTLESCFGVANNLKPPHRENDSIPSRDEKIVEVKESKDTIFMQIPVLMESDIELGVNGEKRSKNFSRKKSEIMKNMELTVGDLEQTPKHGSGDLQLGSKRYKPSETMFESFDSFNSPKSLQKKGDRKNWNLIPAELKDEDGEGIKDILLRYNINQSHPSFYVLKGLDIRNPHKLKILGDNDVFKFFQITANEARSKLPYFIDPNQKLDLSNILRDFLGKDLTNLCLPIKLNEPLTMLQRVCEQFEYAELLDEASKESDSCLRLAYVMAFVQSIYSSLPNRIRKPFIPAFGETFEYTDSSRNFKFFAEQVCSNPPISAEWCESPNFRYWSNTQLSFKFWGKSLEFKPLGVSHLILSKYMDHYVFTKAATTADNLLTGNVIVDTHGEMNFENLATNETGVLFFKQKTLSSKGINEIFGEIKNSKGVVQYEIEGKLTEYFKLKPVNKKSEDIILWKKNKGIEYSLEQYGFTNFTLQLNLLNQNLLKSILPTDSRFRPDVRALEIGELELAQSEKNLVKQNNIKRIERKILNGKPLVARWFKEDFDSVTKSKIYVYQNSFLEERDASTKNYEDLLWF